MPGTFSIRRGVDERRALLFWHIFLSSKSDKKNTIAKFVILFLSLDKVLCSGSARKAAGRGG
jgi:hypothetical protein